MSNLEPCEVIIPEIVKGEDKALTVQLEDQMTKLFVDLSAASEIIALFQNSDGTVLQKKLSTAGITLLSGPSGKFQIILTAAETLLLKETASGSLSDIEVRYILGGKTTIVRIQKAILVVPKLFPTV